MRNLTVSVSITFKDRDKIKQLIYCIKSLLNQTVHPKEVIVVGSEYDTSLLNKYLTQKELRSLKMINFEGGKNEARNTGIITSRGDYVLYMDYDMVAEKNLIEDCLSKCDKSEAIIISEKGAGGGFWAECKKMEKELISFDMHTVTPRFYKRTLFGKDEKPFDERFGLLDEWGFNHQLMKKKVRLGRSDSFVTVFEKDFSIQNEALNKYKRGLWIKNFYQINKEEAWERVNPIQRGIFFYCQKFNYFFKNPLIFSGLVLLKTIDFVSFFSGYLVSLLGFQYPQISEQKGFQRLYDKLGSDYLKDMFLIGKWNQYVDKQEKEIVSEIWNLEKKDAASNQKILDLGMGPGRWSKFFLEKSFNKVIGVDNSPVMVQCARKAIPNRNFQAIEASMEELPFEDNSFDKIFCFRAFKYVDNKKKSILEMERLLKSHGTMILEVSNSSVINMVLKGLSWLILKLNPGISLESRWQYFYGARFFSRDDINNLIATNSSFKVKKLLPFFILPSIPVPKIIDKYGVGLLIKLNNILFRVLPKKYFARSWVLLITKE